MIRGYPPSIVRSTYIGGGINYIIIVELSQVLTIFCTKIYNIFLNLDSGLIVSEFLGGVSSSPMEYCQQLLKKASEYDGFNLITAQLG